MNTVDYVVLGGRGFIGAPLVECLLEQGAKVRSFDRPDSAAKPFESRFGSRFEFFPGDFLSSSDISQALQGARECYHLICTTLPKSSNLNPHYDVETNVLGSLRVLDNALAHGLERVVFASSGGTVYGVPEYSPIDERHPTNPICSYGVTKLAIEKYMLLYNSLHGLDCRILRLANPYGPGQRIDSGQGAVAVFSHRAYSNLPIEIWGDGSAVRDYVFISDAVAALAAAGSYEGCHRVFNVGSGVGVSTNQLVDIIEGVLGKEVDRVTTPARTFDVPANVLDISVAKAELGWAPCVGFEDGVSRLIASFDGLGL